MTSIISFLSLNRAYQIFSKRLEKVELLTGYSDEAFKSAGNVIDELLNITVVHPMRESEALDLLWQEGLGQHTLNDLVDQQMLVRIEHAGKLFYIRKLTIS